MKRQHHLLVIDPQNDFCDLPAAWLPTDPLTGSALAPALPVPGAHADLQRVAALIREGGAGWTDISITLDAHHRTDIAHPTFWQDENGGQVSPFTSIGAIDVRNGKYVPRQSAALPRTLAYLDALEAAGRYQLMVWPVHCEIGSWGQAVHAELRAAYNAWEDLGPGMVTKLSKGSNPWTEHYSAIMAEVPDAGDPDTQLNRSFLAQLEQADVLVICGEAGSHCVKATTEHIVDNFAPSSIAKLVLLEDCMSPVTGFEAQHAAFLKTMAARGVKIASAADLLPELRANAHR